MRPHRLPEVVFSFVFCVACLFCAVLHAQSIATLTGTLTDPSGAAISGAQIQARLMSASAEPYRATSGPDGKFRLDLPAGRYRVTIRHESFRPLEQEFELLAGEARAWNARLELEAMSASVVVSAAAEPAPASTIAAPASILTHDDIAQREEIWLAPLLASTPGATFVRKGPFGGVTTFFLDGGNSNFTKFLIDGTTVNEPGGFINLSNYDLDNVDKVEIVHGASSSLYGSDAMTGVVQLFTHRGTTRTPQLELLGDGGTFGLGHGLGRLSGLVGQFDYSASASYFSTDGQGPNDRLRDTTLSGNFGYRFSDADTLRLTIRNSASDAGVPGQTLLVPPDFDQHNDLHNFSANAAWDFATGEQWRHHLAGTESYNHQIFADPDDFTTVNQFNRAGLEEQSSYLFPQGAVSLGYQYEVENGSANGPHERRNNQGGFVETRYQFGRRWTASAGARAEANASFGTRVVPRGGLVFVARFGHDFWGATRLRASYGLGIKEPDFVQSFENDPCAPGNPNLKPERSKTFNAGVDQFLASDRWKISLNYFHNDFYDIVSFFSGGPVTLNCPFGTSAFFNTDKSRAFGANASLEAKPLRWLRILGNYTYDDTRVLKAPNAFDPTLAPGNRLFQRPLHSASLITNVAFGRMNWNLAGSYVGRRTDSDFLFPPRGITSDPSYVRWDLATSYDLQRNLSLIGRVENLFDRRYQAAVGFPALGLSYRVGLKFLWGGEK
ncbi:MAG: TonB-dependent receptor [Candidatus Acidiferrales bacterium]